MTPLRTSIVGAFMLLWPTTAAIADEAPFLSTDPVSVPAKGEIDIQQWLNWASGHTSASYNDLLSQTEFDYGVTDRLQLALTLVYDWNRTRPAGGPADIQRVPALAAEAIYVLLPVDKNPIGVALAVDPGFDAKSRGIAFRVLLEKYLWGFENVLNVNFENDWEKDGTNHWEASSGISFNYGIARKVDEHWTVALELGNEFDFDELLTSDHLRAEANTFFLGPTLQCEWERTTVTLGMQAQLPWSSGPNASRGYTTEAERFRVGVRLMRVI